MKSEVFEILINDVEKKDKTDGQLMEFIQWCYNHKFLDNLSEKDIEYSIEEKDFYLPLLSNNKMIIAIQDFSWLGTSNKIRIGIDPSACFNKPSQCAIMAYLPFTSKREEKRFYKLLEGILDKKSNIRKDFFKKANTCFCGEFAEFD